MVDKKGTGDKLGELDLGPLGTLVIEDDGDSDSYITVYVEYNGQTSRVGFSDVLMQARQNKGDDAVIDALDRLERVGTSSGGVSPSSFTPSKAAFSCRDCGLSWPGSKNEGTADRPLCPGCAD